MHVGLRFTVVFGAFVLCFDVMASDGSRDEKEKMVQVAVHYLMSGRDELELTLPGNDLLTASSEEAWRALAFAAIREMNFLQQKTDAGIVIYQNQQRELMRCKLDGQLQQGFAGLDTKYGNDLFGLAQQLAVLDKTVKELTQSDIAAAPERARTVDAKLDSLEGKVSALEKEICQQRRIFFASGCAAGFGFAWLLHRTLK